MSSSSKLVILRRLTRFLKSPKASSSSTSSFSSSSICTSCQRSSMHLVQVLKVSRYPPLSSPYRSFCSRSLNLDGEEGPAAIDYRSLLPEGEFHRLADSTIQDLVEKLEEYGDSVDLDGFDIDYGNQVLTLKLGNLGTYVLNKQTPNRQIWLSSPVSGPARFDWDLDAQAWIYRRNKANLFKILESELAQLCGKPISLS